ncbi:methyltransferase [Flocculibacter collagenilyticus]|uniref:methyltransferase n=1 Tax=Flocculibacter collagenilyticus TaxID=2744479 RepID=UPI0018F3CC74|nr:methyltransferase [Flocculibacter collagenilyticus]
MNTHFTFNFSPANATTPVNVELELHRFPQNTTDKSLQAWDAADELLLEYVCEQISTLNIKHIVVLNDQFGAITCVLNALFKHLLITHITDSYIAQQAAQLNLNKNGLNPSNIVWQTSLESLPSQCEMVLLKVPKNKGYLHSQLVNIAALNNQHLSVISAGKVKQIHTSTLSLFEEVLGSTKTSLAKKKARLIFTQCDHISSQPAPFPTTWQLENTPYTMINHANVFSRDSLDLGAREFIKYLPAPSAPQQVVDLGCGNGVIGLNALLKNPYASVTFVDESYMAVQSAKDTITKNLPERVLDCQFLVNDCLSQLEDNHYDLVLCNPPFHQQNTITDHIAVQMFNDARRVLKPGGELRIVGNRHLGYHKTLKKMFSAVTQLGANHKFVILSAIKKSK